MGRSRYMITEIDKPHFLTCTIVEWLPLFTRPALVDIVLNTWRYQQANQGLQLYGYVVLENHLHYLAQSPDLAKSVADFDKSEWRDDVRAFAGFCHALGVPVTLEIARSENGAHAWIFF